MGVIGTTSANRTGVYLAILQLVFTLGWTTYVIYLPKLAADVGIAPSAVILILMLDQAIFTVTDTAMGMAADRISRLVGRLGVFVGAVTAISCAAFVALPFVAGTGPGAQAWFIALIVVWAISSSALRAPPLTLLGKYSAKPQIPFLSALAMLGYGLAGAVSPYLGVVLRDRDARLPFVISSVVLLITALALSRVERGLAQGAQAPDRPPEATKPLGKLPMVFIGNARHCRYQRHPQCITAPLSFPGDRSYHQHPCGRVRHRHQERYLQRAAVRRTFSREPGLSGRAVDRRDGADRGNHLCHVADGREPRWSPQTGLFSDYRQGKVSKAGRARGHDRISRPENRPQKEHVVVSRRGEGGGRPCSRGGSRRNASVRCQMSAIDPTARIEPGALVGRDVRPELVVVHLVDQVG